MVIFYSEMRLVAHLNLCSTIVMAISLRLMLWKTRQKLQFLRWAQQMVYTLVCGL